MATGDSVLLQLTAAGKWTRYSLAQTPYGCMGFDRDGSPAVTPNLVWRQTTSAPTVTNSTTEATLLGTGSGNLSIPANIWTTTAYLRISGFLSVVFASGTLTVSFKVGGQELRKISAITPEAVDIIQFNYLVHPITIGASGNFQSSGSYQATTQQSAMAIGGGSTVDTTAATAIDVTATWSAASSGNIVSAPLVLIEYLP